DELILGHRHSEWTGWAPHIEEDVAFSSIAQDEIGHAAAYYTLAGNILDKSADEIAFGRKPVDYRNATFCERPNGDWAYTLARHWLYDHADDLRLGSLQRSSNPDLANLATKMRREERYHLLHADMWMKRIGHGPVEGRTRLIDALAHAYPDAIGLFEPIEGEEEILRQGLLLTGSEELKQRFVDEIDQALDDLGLPRSVKSTDHAAEFVASSSGDLIEGDEDLPDDGPSDPTGGRTGQHTPEFEELWEVLTLRYREDPGARW
ncbi:MAG: 1,2-phenylacetyl-CoA epoxidase subunit PaaC, partial [Actinomycetota bacterium]